VPNLGHEHIQLVPRFNVVLVYGLVADQNMSIAHQLHLAHILDDAWNILSKLLEETMVHPDQQCAGPDLEVI